MNCVNPDPQVTYVKFWLIKMAGKATKRARSLAGSVSSKRLLNNPGRNALFSLTLVFCAMLLAAHLSIPGHHKHKHEHKQANTHKLQVAESKLQAAAPGKPTSQQTLALPPQEILTLLFFSVLNSVLFSSKDELVLDSISSFKVGDEGLEHGNV